MTYIKSIKLFFLISILLVLFLGLVNFMIDPFQQYRKATLHKTIFMKEFYLNAGLIKNYDYDSVVIGSSMIQNFKINNISKYLNFDKPIKLPISAGKINEHYTILKSAIKIKKVKNVLFGVDILSLRNSKNRLPNYLYDYNLMNDYLYLISIDTLKRSLLYPFLHYTLSKKHPRLDYNLMFQWQHNHLESDFNSTKVLHSFQNKTVDLDEDENQERLLNERTTNIDKYIVPLIKGNPKINFIFFYPPYSILKYKSLEQSQILNNFILTKKYLFKKLSEYKNVKLYDFQIVNSITTNLNNYRDPIHYHQKINTWMLKQIAENNYLTTKENINNYLEELRKQTKSYHIEKVFK